MGTIDSTVYAPKGSIQVGDYLRTKTGIHRVEGVQASTTGSNIIYLSNGGYELEFEVDINHVLLESEVMEDY